MALHKNYVEIIGNLGDAPVYKMSNNGQPRLEFDVAVNEPYKQGDEWKSKVTWFACIAWGNLATTLNRMKFAKGDMVQVEGKGRNNNWVNNQNGEKHNEMQFQVTDMRKMAKPQRNNDGAHQGEHQANGNASSFNQQTDQMYQQQQAANTEDEDGLPF